MIKVVSYGFSIIAFLVFLYSFFRSPDPAIQQQAIYWFYTSLVTALIPNVKQFKIKDFEVQFKEEIKKIEQKIHKLNDEFFKTLETVKASESHLSQEVKAQRTASWHTFNEHLESLPEPERFHEQQRISLKNLHEYLVTVSQLKQQLHKIDYFHGTIDDDFSKELVAALFAFQEDYHLEFIDGMFGKMTYLKLAEVLVEQDHRTSNGI